MLISTTSLPNWTASLQVISSVLVPILVALIGYIINRSLGILNNRLAVSRDLMERRFKDFDELTSGLNDLFCYCTYVGQWREITPIKALEIKRQLDKMVYQSLPIWGNNFLTAYRDFIKVCFSEYAGRATSAKLRADINIHKENWGERWIDEWDQYFIPQNNRLDWSLKQQAYRFLLWEQQKPFHRLLFGIAPSLFSNQVKCAKLSYRRHLVQPNYAKLMMAIGENLGVSIKSKDLLATWRRYGEDTDLKN
ncbi:MAG: hypothetical protein RMZ43_000110 [Nostoc sp. CmiVER01]|uniref:hypothetical protein n=1 Tax=Nostoc sp. CmiVER01 TaxID=3075384 RepID=UPI002AD36FB9|nr:hypothetical protein [Nostoc sp. CmiVER01]MDZ8121875.1 hypothetical protein [Nostoc sp. CmiVER01]